MNQKEKSIQKEEIRGITLIALVVTIVILLILAGITIATLFGENGIINKAREAADATNNAENDTIQGLSNLEENLGVALGEYAWKVSSDGTKVSNKNHPEGIEIGSYVNYDCTPVAGAKTSYVSTADKNGYADQTFTVVDYKNKGYGWRIVGVDNKGQLLLISEETVPSTIEEDDNSWVISFGYEADRTSYLIQGKVGYQNGISELNNICDIYGHGAYATGGKLITIEEINKMTGLNANNIDGNGTKYGAGQIYEYGNTVTYYWDGTVYPYYEYTNSKGEKKTGKLGNYNNGFTYYDESAKEFKTSSKSEAATTENKERITTITSNYYDYYVPGTSMETSNPKLYNTLFANSSTGAYKNPSSNEKGVYYYIDSSAVYTDSDSACWGRGAICEGNVCSDNNSRVDSYGNEYYDYCGVRPAVSLKSNIKLKANGTRDNCTLYDLSEK